MDLDAVLNALRDALRKRGKAAVIQVLWPDDGVTQTLMLSGDIVPGGASPLRGAKERIPRVSELERKVREVLKKTDKPLKGEAIALRAKVRYDGRIRSLLAEMVKRRPGEEGRLIHGPRGGYWPADRSLPGED